MAEFSPEYVELCRKLAVERRGKKGDWFLSFRKGTEPDLDEALHVCSGKNDFFHVPSNFYDWTYVWLPLEGDWLRMLEEAGAIEVIIHGERDQYVAMDGANLHDRDLPLRQGTGSTRLEALARLWMAVTGRDA